MTPNELFVCLCLIWIVACVNAWLLLTVWRELKAVRRLQQIDNKRIGHLNLPIVFDQDCPPDSVYVMRREDWENNQ